jgi:hypothetical protein
MADVLSHKRFQDEEAAYEWVESHLWPDGPVCPRFLLSLKQANITTLLVHHSRKDGNSPRGSQSLEVTFEVILGLKRPEDAPASKACFMSDFTKYRGQGGYVDPAA